MHPSYFQGGFLESNDFRMHMPVQHPRYHQAGTPSSMMSPPYPRYVNVLAMHRQIHATPNNIDQGSIMNGIGDQYCCLVQPSIVLPMHSHQSPISSHGYPHCGQHSPYVRPYNMMDVSPYAGGNWPMFFNTPPGFQAPQLNYHPVVIALPQGNLSPLSPSPIRAQFSRKRKMEEWAVIPAKKFATGSRPEPARRQLCVPATPLRDSDRPSGVFSEIMPLPPQAPTKVCNRPLLSSIQDRNQRIYAPGNPLPWGLHVHRSAL